MKPQGKRYRAIAEYYDAEYAESKMLQEDVPFFLGQLPKRRQSILELCVGTARAAIPLAQAGHRVVGVDYDPKLLEIARRKRDSVAIPEHNLQLIPGDVLKLNLDQRFDWICLFFNTLLAFPSQIEEDALLKRVRDHLKPRGRFWLDIFQPDLNILAGRQTKSFDPHFFYVPSLNRSVYQTTEIKRHLSKQTQDVTFHYQWFDEKGRQHYQKNSFQMTWLFPRELCLILERNGLRVEQMFGNYDGSEVTATAPRIIARCVAI